MQIKVGDRLPNIKVWTMSNDVPEEIETDSLFKGKKVVLVAVPGAFTPTCTLNHLPGYINDAQAIISRGIDYIVVTAVNDAYVLDAWAKQTTGGNQQKIIFMADGNADFAKAIGMTFDGSGSGLGTRSLRYSMLVKDGEVKMLNIEENPGEATVSSAQTMVGVL